MDIVKRDHWDKHKGFTAEKFNEALEKTEGNKYPQRIDKLYHDSVDYFKNGSPQEDPYSHLKKPEGVPTWDHPPSTPQEEAIYYGMHMHSETNPLGLHSHVPGGKLGGGHSHGPQNRFGAHHHKDNPGEQADLDGQHEHCGKHYPDGKHEHHPDNFN